MHHNTYAPNFSKRLISLLFALVLLIVPFGTAAASDAFFISGVIPSNFKGIAYIQVTDLENKVPNAQLSIGGVAVSAQFQNDAIGTTYWLVIDVSKAPSEIIHNMNAIKTSAISLASLPTGKNDSVRIVWVSDTTEITSSLSPSDARILLGTAVESRFKAYGKSASALHDGISKAIDGAMASPDRFHRIFVVTDGSDVTVLNNLSSKLNVPVPLYAIMLTNTYSANTLAGFAAGHDVLRSFINTHDGIAVTVDMLNVAEQVSAACTLFQSHISNAHTICVDLKTIISKISAKSDKTEIKIVSGSDSDSCNVNLNLKVVPTPTPQATASPTPKVTKAPAATATASPTPTPKPEFKKLAYGDKDVGTDTYINDMQSRLKVLNFLTTSFVPGQYDTATAKAIKAFAEQNSITLSAQDGTEITERELRQLFDNSAEKKHTATPKPTSTPTPRPTATPEFIDLSIGDSDTGDEVYVTTMQSYLAHLGFFAENYTPGEYDEATANAMRAFCERAGLNVTNNGTEVSVRILQLLSMSNVTPTPVPTPTPSPTPTPAPTPVPERIDLEYGYVDNPEYPYVSTMQARLYELGYITDETIYTYGMYDDGTVGALIQFCAENNQPLEENGYKASVSLLRFLYGGLARPHVTPTPAPTATPTPAPTPAPDFIALKIGDKDSGDAKYVLNMQAKLASLGFFAEGESYTPGEYDNATANALRAFCIRAGFNTDTDGTMVSENILIFLNSSNVTPTPVPTFTPIPTATPSPTPLPDLIALEFGHVDSEEYTHVFNMQNRLKELGYLTNPSVTFGTYDEITADALRQFCFENQITPVDNGSSAPLSILRLLMGTSAVPKPTPTPIPTATPEPTSTPIPAFIDLKLSQTDAEGTDFIIRMQGRLNELGYFDDSFQPGIYEKSTADALLLFCQQGGYDVSSNGEYVKASFLESFLFNEHAPVRIVVEPPLSEKLLAALTSSIMLFGLALPMWVVVAVCAALIVLIVVLIIVIAARNRKKSDSAIHKTISATIEPSIADISNVHDGMTTAGTDEEMTIADDTSFDFSGINSMSIELDIRYRNRTIFNSNVSINGQLTIGRGKTASGMECDIKTDPTDKSVSRHHCTLIVEDGRLKVRNESAQERGTILNNVSLTGSNLASEEAMTSADDFGSNEDYVNNGDTLQIGNHYITITY